MRSLKTLVGFVLILGLLTLGVVGLDYLNAPQALQLAFAILLAAFGLVTFVIAILGRPTAGTILSTAGAAIALFVAVRDVFSTTLDLLLFALVIFDVIVLFILFGEIDRDRERRVRILAKVRRTDVKAEKTVKAEPTPAKAPVKKVAKAPAKKATVKKAPAKKPSVKKASTKKAAPVKATTSVPARFVASKNREGGSFHLVNCYIAQRIDQDDRAYFPTREKALEKAHKPCRVCNP